MESTLSERIARIIADVPRGRVATYGQIASLAGNPRAARAVVWVLRRNPSKRDDTGSEGSEPEADESVSQSPHHLPWHRIINSQGRIALPRGGGFELQRALLLDEGVSVTAAGRIDLDRWLWRPDAWEVVPKTDRDVR